jgi:hypothetical protein
MSQMLAICDWWSCCLRMFLYRNVHLCVYAVSTLGASSGIGCSLFWVSSDSQPLLALTLGDNSSS